MSEKPLCNTCQASVMIYDDAERRWLTAGHTPGLSGVNLYQHMMENTFRVVARKEQDGEVVINCAVIPQLKYNRATPTFHQWRDSRTVYGLNFTNPNDANAFAAAMEDALAMLCNGFANSPPAGPSPAEIEAKRREQEQQERQERERLENERLTRQRAAAAAPNPPPSGGVPPPPPPPPPPPASAPSPAAAPAAAPPSGSMQGGLAAALAGAKLKKTPVVEREDNAPAPSSGGGGLDLMGELQKKMMKRRAAAQNGDSGTKPAPAIITPAPKPAANNSPATETKRPWQKTNNSSANAAGKFNASEANITRRLSFGTKKLSTASSGCNSSDLDQLKKDILSEMKTEIQKMKDEILQVIREEMNK